MPVYKGNNEVTSGNLYKGTTEIQDGYKATDSFYVNEITLTIAFVDSTSSNINLDSASSVSFTGVPGNSWTSFNRNLTRANGTVRITGAAGSKSGDTQNILNIVESGSGSITRQLTFSGTLPTVSQTIIVTITDSFVNLIARSMTVGPGGSSTNSNIAIGTISWTGDGTAVLKGTTNYGGGRLERSGTVIAFHPFTISAGGGAFPYFVNGASDYSNDVDSSGGPITTKTNTYTLTLPETLTYQAGSVSASYSKLE